MAGFTLGSSGGATLGTSTGGTLGTARGVWYLDGQRLPEVTGEVSTRDTLSLSFRTTSTVLRNVLRPLKSDQGKVDTLGKDGGGFVSVDRADGANTFTLTPPDRRTPLRFEGDYHVETYEEDLVSQTVGEWQVEVEFAYADNRTDTHPLSVGDLGNTSLTGADAGSTLGERSGFTLGGATGASLGNQRTGIAGDTWGLTTPDGTLATDRVDAEFLGTGEDGVQRFELRARLTFTQALTFESSLARIGSVRIRDVPDATNEAVDDSTNDVSTITVDSPTEETVADASYVVLAWESERLTDAYQEIELEIATTA